MKHVPISQVIPNKTNPRFIKDDKFKKLVQSIKDFPQMLELRPIVVDSEMVVLGGNMRLKACQAAGLAEVPILIADQLTPEQQQEFIIKDNVGFGEWDWDVLANEWEAEDLERWGMDLPVESDDSEYTTKVESPIYTPKGIKPKEDQLASLHKYNRLVEAIDASDIEEEKKTFLKLAATRHIQFDYRMIAEYYAHEDAKVQSLMEDSALVIIDYDKAIEHGFVELFETFDNLAALDE
jgi:ParB-like chromosome segregation protein Spo0J